jgi:glycosyltransferase involved in cell wall biosynthesis
MVAYAFYEGNTRIQQYATALAKRGDAVDVIALRREGEPRYRLVNGVNVYGIQSRIINEKSPLTYLYRITQFLVHAAWVLGRKHLSTPYHLVHVHSVPDFLAFAAFLPKLTGSSVILDIHDILPEFYASKFGTDRGALLFRLLVLVEKCSAAFADHVIIANHLWYERLIARSVRPEKCIVICNYPNPEFFRARPRGRTGSKFVITYPGTLNWHQGLDIAVRAFAKVAEEVPEAEFRIFGEGPSKPELIKLTDQLGLNGRVVFNDMVPTERIAQEVANSDLGVVPKRASSIFGNEAASTKILEFMATGVPVVVSRTKVDTYYHSDLTVKFFESENESDLAKSILELKRNADLRSRLVANAAEYAQKNNWEIKGKQYLNLVDSLTSAKRKGSRSPVVPT